MDIVEAKQSLDKVIDKARVHLYKPIQIAEILYRHRVHQDITLSDLSTYRTQSRKWRDLVCLQFLGRISNSSARYQDDLFNINATPPIVMAVLGEENMVTAGIVEAYIYRKFKKRFSQMSTGLDYCFLHDKTSFSLERFLTMFWHEPGLRRSVDKIYEIVVYSLFSALVEALDISVSVSINPEKTELLNEFSDFAKQVIELTPEQTTLKVKAKINRVGVTNAADRGLDMWANFGMAIQIKHLSLTEELAENIVSSVSADRIVIVCKDAEQKMLVSLLTQLGWKSRIQSVVTETDLFNWYERALRGKFANLIGDNVLHKLSNEIQTEFPSTDGKEFDDFIRRRGYESLINSRWC